MVAPVVTPGSEVVTPKKPESWFGLIVVLVGIAAVLAVFGFALYKGEPVASATTAATSVGGVIASMVAAFFGVHVAQTSKNKAEGQREMAEAKVEKLAGMMDRDKYDEVVKANSVLFASPQSPS